MRKKLKPKAQHKVMVVCGKKTKTITLNKPSVLTIFTLGDEKRGWIPSAKHFEVFKQLLAEVEAGTTDKLIFHYGVKVRQVRL